MWRILVDDGELRGSDGFGCLCGAHRGWEAHVSGPGQQGRFVLDFEIVCLERLA